MLGVICIEDGSEPRGEIEWPEDGMYPQQSRYGGVIMQAWFIATEKFGPCRGKAWDRYVAQLSELVSLDEMLCPSVLSQIKDSYWAHIVNEDYMPRYFRGLRFLLTEIAAGYSGHKHPVRLSRSAISTWRTEQCYLFRISRL
jgi:hypothetical protein